MDFTPRKKLSVYCVHFDVVNDRWWKTCIFFSNDSMKVSVCVYTVVPFLHATLH